jgi:hypothetical protein
MRKDRSDHKRGDGDLDQGSKKGIQHPQPVRAGLPAGDSSTGDNSGMTGRQHLRACSPYEIFGYWAFSDAAAGAVD